jgi:hypothetical protein
MGFALSNPKSNSAMKNQCSCTHVAGAVMLLLAILNPQLSFAQGSLTPPGAPAPAMKTLAQVEPRTPISSEPYTITQPGSYYLTTNLIGGALVGIDINADNVTLDLNGFAVIGPGNAGINVEDGHTNTVIRNGTVQNWANTAVFAGRAYNCQVERLLVSGNGRGIWGGTNATVSSCTVQSNTLFGINCEQGSLIQGCTVGNTGQSGISSGASSTVKDCAVQGNASDGISVGESSIVSGCTARGNALNGIFVAGNCTVNDCVTKNNALDGFHSDTGCVFSHCSATFNTGNGFSLGIGNTITASSAARNTGAGFNLNNGGTIKDCSCYFNHGNGITAASYCTIQNCTADFGDADGIVANSGCRITENNVTRNGSSGNAGIRVLGSGNRIEANNAVNNIGYGINMAAGNNFLVRNSANGQSINFFASGLSTFGPIDTHTGSITNLSAWANFEY